MSVARCTECPSSPATRGDDGGAPPAQPAAAPIQSSSKIAARKLDGLPGRRSTAESIDSRAQHRSGIFESDNSIPVTRCSSHRLARLVKKSIGGNRYVSALGVPSAPAGCKAMDAARAALYPCNYPRSTTIRRFKTGATGWPGLTRLPKPAPTTNEVGTDHADTKGGLHEGGVATGAVHARKS